MKKYLRIAGNTEAPCYYALLEKGYQIKLVSCVLLNPEGTDCRYEFEATKEGLDYIVSATTMYELLALVVMGELRGFAHADWNPSFEEKAYYFDLKDEAPLYDYQGNLVLEE